jgi:hypothetical protein
MKKAVVILLVLILFVGITPAAAAQKVRIGEEINVLAQTPTEFPAGEPFHIDHGWLWRLGVDPTIGIGLFNFELEVDGNPIDEDFVEHAVVKGDPIFGDTLTFSWVYNFPEGMTGTHTFTGHWLCPCEVAVEYGYIEGPCTQPAEVIEVITKTLTVTFIP